MVSEKIINNEKKLILLKAIGKVLKKKRKKLNKGILLLSYEYDLSNTSLAQLEKGARDVQITTIWKIANALGMSFSEFTKEVENHLPKDFKLVDD